MTDGKRTFRLAPLALALALSAAPAVAPSRAQGQEAEAPAAGSDESGRPIDGYIATALFAFLILFIVGKSARR